MIKHDDDFYGHPQANVSYEQRIAVLNSAVEDLGNKLADREETIALKCTQLKNAETEIAMLKGRLSNSYEADSKRYKWLIEKHKVRTDVCWSVGWPSKGEYDQAVDVEIALDKLNKASNT